MEPKILITPHQKQSLVESYQVLSELRSLAQTDAEYVRLNDACIMLARLFSILTLGE